MGSILFLRGRFYGLDIPVGGGLFNPLWVLAAYLVKAGLVACGPSSINLLSCFGRRAAPALGAVFDLSGLHRFDGGLPGLRARRWFECWPGVSMGGWPTGDRGVKAEPLRRPVLTRCLVPPLTFPS